MKTLYKFFKTAEVSQEIIIHQKVKVEKYNLVKILLKAKNLLYILKLASKKAIIIKFKSKFIKTLLIFERL
jgi:hypothetical protein